MPRLVHDAKVRGVDCAVSHILFRTIGQLGGPGYYRVSDVVADPDRITRDSLLAQLATARQRNRELQQKVHALERRLGAQGPSIGPALLDQHPVVIELRKRLAEVELDVVEKDRTIMSLHEDIEVLRETNRSVVGEYGLRSQ